MSSNLPPDQPSRSYPGSLANGASASSGQGRQITMWALLDAFRRRWLPALSIGIPSSIVMAAVVWQLVPATYESAALLQIHQFEQRVAFETVDQRSDFLNYRDTQINYLQSRTVLSAAVRRDGVMDTQTLKDVKHPVEWLEKQLQVESDISPEFIRISLNGEHPEDLAIIVNAVKDAYLEDVPYNEHKDRIEKLKAAEAEFAELDQKVRKNEERIDQLASDLGTSDSKTSIANQSLIQEQLRELQAELRQLNARIRSEEAAQQYLKERGLNPNQSGVLMPGAGLTAISPNSAENVVADQNSLLQRQLFDVRRQIQQFESQLRNPNHPDLIRLKKEEKQLNETLAGGRPSSTPAPSSSLAMSHHEHLMKQRQQIQVEIATLSERYRVIGARAVELEREKSRFAHDKKIRDGLADQISREQIELNAPQRVVVRQHANVPEVASTKKRVQLSFLTAMAVFGSIIGGFTLFEWFSFRIGRTSDITTAANLRLIGTIPSPDKGGLLGLGIFAGKVDYDEWNRAVVESMDVVRTYLMRHIDPARPASILVTSASANEGKTTVSCQLAASLARTGRQVVLVDCDFRRPSAHLMMECQEGPGICEYLRGELTLEQIAQPTQAPGLTFIGAGTVDQVTLQNLAADGGRSMIEKLKSEYDFVIVDTSPLLFVAEPSMLAQNADVVLLSTRKDYSRVPYVMQTRDSLRSLQVPLLGSVMVGSDADFQRQSYGYRQNVQRHRHKVSV